MYDLNKFGDAAKKEMKIETLNGPSFYSFGDQKPTDVIVLLHGYGSCGKDLISLSKHLEDVFERPYFIAPNAPFSYEWECKDH